MNKANLVGQRFGKLLVVENAASRNSKATWVCACDCGGCTVSTTGNLRSGGATSCGCNKTKHGHTVGGKTSPTFKTWHSMLGRCLDPSHKNYHRYGGRGIRVSPDWLEFSGFLADMGDRPAERTLDRKDNNGPYDKQNCRWATRHEQSRNKSSNRVIVVDGTARIITDWASILGVKEPNIYNFATRKGVSLEEAVLHFIWRDK